ncbi:MAG: methylcrotonoyl-CoA carboxylase [Deltaproteobacteria bacterium]|nr:methylcrotonoyl-CoA carboxylase [Deltaproteobacteria bacterium]
MSILKSNLNINSEQYKKNYLDYQSLLAKLNSYLQNSLTPHSKKTEELARRRNKLLVEERITHLLDPGSPYLAVAPLAGAEVYEGLPPGAGIHTLIARISGRKCMVIANNSTIKGGTYFPLTVKKHLRAQEIAVENKLPCIYLVDSGGAFLPLQDEIFPDRFHFGRIFYNQALMSSMGIPQISVVLGSCTAGGAYVPAMSDETIMVRGNASIFLGGPPLVKAATGEIVSAEELGGTDVHCGISGVSDHSADNEVDALKRAREIIASLGPESSSIERLVAKHSTEPPLYDPQEIYGIVGADLRKSFSVMEVIARLVDGSRFEEFKAQYGKTIKCGFSHIYGFLVGVIANDGILFSESALKATHFIQLCNQRGIPLLFLQNVVGFMVGKSYEHDGIAKHGAKMVTAVATSSVPKFTLIIGGSFGAGNYGMCGRAYDPRFLFTWPNSQISVMGEDQAAEVMAQVKFDNSDNPTCHSERNEFKSKIKEKYRNENGAWYASARLWDDGIIDPLKTRETLALAFASSLIAQDSSSRFGIFRM